MNLLRIILLIFANKSLFKLPRLIYFIGYSIFVGIIFYLLADYFIIFIYGEDFQSSVAVLRYLSFALILLVLNRLYNYTLLAMKQNSYYFKITFFGMCINLILNYILILKYGVLGAVFATIATEMVVVMLGWLKMLNIMRYHNAI